jgi:hypothetical protein
VCWARGNVGRKARPLSTEGNRLFEQEGINPDIVVDNLAHATFNGRDAQLEAAIAYLEKKIAEDPRSVPKPPRTPGACSRTPPAGSSATARGATGDSARCFIPLDPRLSP